MQTQPLLNNYLNLFNQYKSTQIEPQVGQIWADHHSNINIDRIIEPQGCIQIDMVFHMSQVKNIFLIKVLLISALILPYLNTFLLFGRLQKVIFQ